MGKYLEASIAALNGLVGDHLQGSANGLAIEMELFGSSTIGDPPIDLASLSFAERLRAAEGRVVILVHGLMCNENIFAFKGGGDYGERLASDSGVLPLYLRYNTGLPIVLNGEAFARLLDRLISEARSPIQRIDFIGYSMGGLVVRSACHVAAIGKEANPSDDTRGTWLNKVRRSIYLGTPHRGAPMERAGRVLVRWIGKVQDPYADLIRTIADLRSAGIRDLGDADIREEDRQRRTSTLGIRDARHPVPLLPQIDHFLLAASLVDHSFLDSFFGDALVTVRSGTNDALDPAGLDKSQLALPPSNIKLLRGLSHLDIPHDPSIYPIIQEWLEAP